VGFEQAIQMTIDHGRAVFAEKWGHRDCDIVGLGWRLGMRGGWSMVGNGFMSWW
jgi:hypothetical protein